MDDIMPKEDGQHVASNGSTGSSGENVSASSHLEEELRTCKAKQEEYLDGWKRAKADFINYKKEEVARFEEFARYASEDLIRDLIQALDSFDLGIASLEKQGNVEKGIYMIRGQIEDTLKRRGLYRITIRAGDTYDPSLAEAVGEVASSHPPGTVAEEIEAGYRLHDKVVRPARVKIAK